MEADQGTQQGTVEQNLMQQTEATTETQPEPHAETGTQQDVNLSTETGEHEVEIASAEDANGQINLEGNQTEAPADATPATDGAEVPAIEAAQEAADAGIESIETDTAAQKGTEDAVRTENGADAQAKDNTAENGTFKGEAAGDVPANTVSDGAGNEAGTNSVQVADGSAPTATGEVNVMTQETAAGDSDAADASMPDAGAEAVTSAPEVASMPDAGTKAEATAAETAADDGVQTGDKNAAAAATAGQNQGPQGGAHGDEDPMLGYNLFVANAPLDWDADRCKELFQEFGTIHLISIIKHHATGDPTGTLFVTYIDQAAAEAAIEKLHKQVRLEGSDRDLEVTWSRRRASVVPGKGPPDNRALFFGKGPPGVTETAIRDLFGGYGTVTEVKMFRDKFTGSNSGCGVITYAKRDFAVKAMDALDGKFTMKGSKVPLIVQWHDPDLQTKKRKAQDLERGVTGQEVEKDNNTLFFARVPPTIKEEDIIGFFQGQHNYEVKELTIFRHPGTQDARGYGLVQFESHEVAVKVLETLHNVHTFPGATDPMLLKWSEPPEKRRKAGDPYGTPAAGAPGYRADKEVPPPGCDPDAIRLFVGDLPRETNKQEAEEFFSRWGKVVDLYLVKDHYTGQFKGVAYLWFAHRRDADICMAAVDQKLALPSHPDSRPITVHKAIPKPSAHGAAPRVMQGGRSPGRGYATPQASYAPGRGGYGGGRGGADPHRYDSRAAPGGGYRGGGRGVVAPYSDPNPAYNRSRYDEGGRGGGRYGGSQGYGGPSGGYGGPSRGYDQGGGYPAHGGRGGGRGYDGGYDRPDYPRGGGHGGYEGGHAREGRGGGWGGGRNAGGTPPSAVAGGYGREEYGRRDDYGGRGGGQYGGRGGAGYESGYRGPSSYDYTSNRSYTPQGAAAERAGGGYSSQAGSYPAQGAAYTRTEYGSQGAPGAASTYAGGQGGSYAAGGQSDYRSQAQTGYTRSDYRTDASAYGKSNAGYGGGAPQDGAASYGAAPAAASAGGGYGVTGAGTGAGAYGSAATAGGGYDTRQVPLSSNYAPAQSYSTQQPAAGSGYAATGNYGASATTAVTPAAGYSTQTPAGVSSYGGSGYTAGGTAGATGGGSYGTGGAAAGMGGGGYGSGGAAAGVGGGYGTGGMAAGAGTGGYATTGGGGYGASVGAGGYSTGVAADGVAGNGTGGYGSGAYSPGAGAATGGPAGGYQAGYQAASHHQGSYQQY